MCSRMSGSFLLQRRLIAIWSIWDYWYVDCGGRQVTLYFLLCLKLLFARNRLSSGHSCNRQYPLSIYWTTKPQDPPKYLLIWFTYNSLYKPYVYTKHGIVYWNFMLCSTIYDLLVIMNSIEFQLVNNLFIVVYVWNDLHIIRRTIGSKLNLKVV